MPQRIQALLAVLIEYGVVPTRTRPGLALALAALDVRQFNALIGSLDQAVQDGRAYRPRPFNGLAQPWQAHPALTYLLDCMWFQGCASRGLEHVSAKEPLIGRGPSRIANEHRRRSRVVKGPLMDSSNEATPFLETGTIAQALAEAKAAATQVGATIALAGGVAMQQYRSPRMTRDIDFVTDRVPNLPVVGPLSFGGQRMQLPNGVFSDWIVRNDEFAGLYEEALVHAAPGPAGVRIITPEYLAVMKLAARRTKDQEDLLTLLRLKLVDLPKARDIVRRHVGGRFGVDEFNSFVLEAEWQRVRDQQIERGT